MKNTIFKSMKEIHNIFNENIYDIEVETKSGYCKVTNTFTKESTGFKITLENDKVIRCANTHLMISNNEWCSADELNINDYLLDKNNKYVKIIKKEFVPIQIWYDIQIDNEHESYIHNDIIHHNSGKSLILYMLMMFYNWKQKKIMLIVPDVGLVNQMFNDMNDYFTSEELSIKEHIAQAHSKGVISDLNKKLNTLYVNIDKLTHKQPFDDIFCMIFAGQEKFSSHNIKISTWQSTAKLASDGYFNEIDAIFFDEVHLSASSSAIEINKNCNASVKIGLSGTQKPDLIGQLIIEGTIGKAVRIVSAKKLIDMGLATETLIQPIVLKYSTDTVKAVKKMKWQEEDKFIREHEGRLNFLKKFLIHLSKSGNVIIIFKNVAIQKILLKMVKETHENVFMINGSVKAEDRETIRTSMSEYSNAILIGTVTVLSTGINIKSLKHLVFGSIGKAEIKTIQAIGRVMRLHDDKDTAHVWDIVDDLTYITKSGKEYPNYYMKHYYDRVNSYHKYEFPIQQQQVIQLEKEIF